MSKHIEMIEDYIIRQSKDTDYNPTSYEWSDNHGILTRCKDCKYHIEDCHCVLDGIRHWRTRSEDDYCSYAVRKENL